MKKERIKVTLVERDQWGCTVTKTVTCTEHHTANTSRDAWEVFYGRYRTAVDMPREWGALPEAERKALIANTLSRGMLGSQRCDYLILEAVYI